MQELSRLQARLFCAKLEMLTADYKLHWRKYGQGKYSFYSVWIGDGYISLSPEEESFDFSILDKNYKLTHQFIGKANTQEGEICQDLLKTIERWRERNLKDLQPILELIDKIKTVSKCA